MQFLLCYVLNRTGTMPPTRVIKHGYLPFILHGADLCVEENTRLVPTFSSVPWYPVVTLLECEHIWQRLASIPALH